MSAIEEELHGSNRAAALLLALGEELAVEIMQLLDPREVHRLGKTMVILDGKKLSSPALLNVCRHFEQDAKVNTHYAIGNDTYVRKILERSLGPERAESYIERILTQYDTRGLDELRWMDPRAIAEAIRFEHPQIIALVLAYLEPPQGADVLKRLQPHQQSDVIMRLSRLETIQPNALTTLSESLERQLSGSGEVPYEGVKLAAEIMNYVEEDLEKTIFGEFEKSDKPQAQKVRDNMFLFEDFIRISDMDMQKLIVAILRGDKELGVERYDLIRGLKPASQGLREHFYKNMSTLNRQNIQEEVSYLGPLPWSDVEASQRKIIALARKLEQSPNPAESIKLSRSAGRMV
jgi:flagellar motor switch protein FliG